jgi:glucose-6-phosphate isomerase
MIYAAELEAEARLALTKPLTELFLNDALRVDRFVISSCGIRFDFTKTHVTEGLLHAFREVASNNGFSRKIKDLCVGAIVNGTEKRAALHTAWRGRFVPEVAADGSSVAALIADANTRLEALVRAWRSSDAKAIIHIGIGGSALGPELALRALEPIAERRFDVRLLANVDGEAFERAVAGLDPKSVRVVIASKSWSTQETQHNAERVRSWLLAGGVANPGDVMAAVTQKVDAAAAWGIDPDRVFPNPAWVGGRYSVWSPIGLPVALQIGWPSFEAFRAGAGAMDDHFMSAEMYKNAPIISGLMGFCYSEYLASGSRALFSYDERLKLLPAHLSQLELESLGKSVDVDGKPVVKSCAALWGGTGTDAQHAVFQFLHQGTTLVPVDFIAVREKSHKNLESHRLLLANCFAQGAALMLGRTAGATADLLRAQSLSEEDVASLVPHMTFPGNRPSTTILLDRLTPETLGALIAFYEHRTYVQSILWNINAFDQFGVELGKQLASQILKDRGSSMDAGTQALAALLP